MLFSHKYVSTNPVTHESPYSYSMEDMSVKDQEYSARENPSILSIITNNEKMIHPLGYKAETGARIVDKKERYVLSYRERHTGRGKSGAAAENS